jgi:hypothetical protein
LIPVLGSCLAAILIVSAFATDAGRGARVDRIPVAVRVLDNGQFVSDLTLADFEIVESGMPVQPEALFLVRKNTVEHREGWEGPSPDFSRRLVILFQLTDYHTKIPEALNFLFGEELVTGDSLDIQTPMRNYRLTPAALAAKAPGVLARELSDIVKKDIGQGGMAYKSALRNLRRLVRSIGGSTLGGVSDADEDTDFGSSLEQQLMQYADYLGKMETMRAIDEAKLLDFAGGMKTTPGQKHVFFVYQREFRPEISPQSLDNLVMANQDRPDILAHVQTLFQMYSRPLGLSSQRLGRAFSDSGMRFNFLYMNREPERISGIYLREQSEDVFKALSQVAKATGGVFDSSQNPAQSIIAALKASESAYYLYYTPSAAAPPGTFFDISVKVKGRDYRVEHRSGYLTGSR